MIKFYSNCLWETGCFQSHYNSKRFTTDRLLNDNIILWSNSVLGLCNPTRGNIIIACIHTILLSPIRLQYKYRRTLLPSNSFWLATIIIPNLWYVFCRLNSSHNGTTNNFPCNLLLTATSTERNRLDRPCNIDPGLTVQKMFSLRRDMGVVQLLDKSGGLDWWAWSMPA